VFSVMRDGRDLADRLRQSRKLPPGPDRVAVLRSVVDPYVQIVDPHGMCEFTGLRLLDIWRYFRHTWNTAYLSTPGRKVWVLVRDRAAPNHPIIGIGALGSAIVQLAPRDRWIGWTSEVLLKSLREKPTAAWARWLHSSLKELI